MTYPDIIHANAAGALRASEITRQEIDRAIAWLLSLIRRIADVERAVMS